MLPLFVVIVVSCASPPTPREDGLAARFLKEYPEASRTLKAAYARVRGRCQIETRLTPGSGGEVLSQIADFAIDRGYRKFSMKRTLKSGRSLVDIVYCVGNGSAFGLERKNDASPYRVTRSGSEDRHVQGVYNIEVGRYVDVAYFVYTRPLDVYLTIPGFRITGAQEIIESNHKLVQLECQCEQGPKGSLTKIKLVLDPSLYWAIRRYELWPGFLPGAHATFDAVYKVDGSSIPVPLRVRARDVGSEDIEAVFETFAFEGTPEVEFTMAHYGLPDLSRKAPARSFEEWGYLPWLLAFGSVGLALGAILYYRFVRRR